LDHDGICKTAAQDFLACLDKAESDHFACRKLSRAYLECRMQNKLMAQENLDKLGLKEDEDAGKRRNARDEEGKREMEGFLAGGNQQPRKKGWLW